MYILYSWWRKLAIHEIFPTAVRGMMFSVGTIVRLFDLFIYYIRNLEGVAFLHQGRSNSIKLKSVAYWRHPLFGWKTIIFPTTSLWNHIKKYDLIYLFGNSAFWGSHNNQQKFLLGQSDRHKKVDQSGRCVPVRKRRP